MKGTLPIVPHLGDLTFLRGRTVSYQDSGLWEIITDGEAEFKHKNSGFRVKMNILEDNKISELQANNKRKGKKENKERKTSSFWKEIEFNKETGSRVLFWDLYCVK